MTELLLFPLLLSACAVVVRADLQETNKFSIYSELAMVSEDELGKHLNTCETSSSVGARNKERNYPDDCQRH